MTSNVAYAKLGTMLFIILLGNVCLYAIYQDAPDKSIEWLKDNPIWNYLIIGVFNFSLLTSQIGLLFRSSNRVCMERKVNNGVPEAV